MCSAPVCEQTLRSTERRCLLSRAVSGRTSSRPTRGPSTQGWLMRQRAKPCCRILSLTDADSSIGEHIYNEVFRSRGAHSASVRLDVLPIAFDQERFVVASLLEASQRFFSSRKVTLEDGLKFPIVNF